MTVSNQTLTTTYTKVPPQALDIERTVLGSMLIDSNVLDTAMELLNEDCFYSSANKKIFLCIKSMYLHDSTVDIITLAEELRKKQWFDEIGAEPYLSELVEYVATSAHIASHAKILQSKAVLRDLISTAAEITTDCFKPDAESKTIVDQAEAKIFRIAEASMKGRPERIGDLLSTTFEDIERYSKEGGVSGVKSGFEKLDEMTTGFHPGDLVIIAARPGMGKTAFCLSITMNAGIHTKKPTTTVIFSLEMSKAQLVQRMLCAEAQIDIHRLRGGRLTSNERQRLGIHAGALHEAPVYIDDTPGINVMEIRAKCRRLKQKENLGLIMIDYLQLMGIVERAENRQQEISQISRSLKEIAKELNVPVIALSQLSRAVEQRNESRPQLSDLRESGAIEQDADLVLFVYRRSKYFPDDENAKGKAEIIIGKQRNGPTGSCHLAFKDEFATFYNIDKTHNDENQEF